MVNDPTIAAGAESKVVSMHKQTAFTRALILLSQISEIFQAS